MESNSTCVYYRFSEGLGDVTAGPSRNEEDNKREKLDFEIKKLSPFIQQSAMYGMSLPVVSKKPPNK